MSETVSETATSVAESVARALAGIDVEAVRRQYWDQNEFVYLERWLAAPLIDRMLAEVDRARPAINRNYIPRHKKGGSVSFHTLVEQARNTPDDAERWDLYGQMEEIMFGPDGAVPTIPIYWYTYVTLESESIQDTFNLNPLDQIDLTLVTEGDQGDEEVSG